MLVRDYMTPKPVTMKPLDSARAARELMLERRIQQVPVVARGKLVGIVTDRDIRDVFPTAVVSHLGKEIDDFTNKITLESVMTADVLTIGPGEPVSRAAELLRARRIGSLPVVDEGKLVGIITRSDLLGAFVDLVKREDERR
jgi:acetoin utilization protein AcuB